jgi:hypothetical protein
MWFQPHAVGTSVFANPSVEVSDPAAVLGIKPTSDTQAIKQAYRKRAMETHPDRGGDPSEFLAVTKAYEMAMAGNWGSASKAASRRRPTSPKAKGRGVRTPHQRPQTMPADYGQLAQALRMADEYYADAVEAFERGNEAEAQSLLTHAATQVVRAEVVVARITLPPREQSALAATIQKLRRDIESLRSRMAPAAKPAQRDVLERAQVFFKRAVALYQKATVTGNRDDFAGAWLALSDARRELDRVAQTLSEGAGSIPARAQITSFEQSLHQLRGAIWQAFAAEDAAQTLKARAVTRLSSAKSDWQRKRAGATLTAAQDAFAHAEQASMVARDISDASVRFKLDVELGKLVEEARVYYDMAQAASAKKTTHKGRKRKRR